LPWGQKDKVRFVSARFIVSAIRVRGFQNSNLDSCLAGGGFGNRCGRRLPVAAGEWSRAVRHCGGMAGGRYRGSRGRGVTVVTRQAVAAEAVAAFAAGECRC